MREPSVGIDMQKVQKVLRGVFEIDVVADDFRKAKGRQQHQYSLSGFEDGNGAQPAMVIAMLRFGRDWYVCRPFSKLGPPARACEATSVRQSNSKLTSQPTSFWMQLAGARG